MEPIAKGVNRAQLFQYREKTAPCIVSAFWRDMQENRTGSLDIPECYITKSMQDSILSVKPQCASVFAARVCVESATHGKAFWQRPRAIPAPCDTLGVLKNSFEPLYYRGLEGCKLSIC